MFKKVFAAFMLVIMLMGTGFVSGQGVGVVAVEPLTPAPSAEDGVLVNETPNLYFVELESAPTIEGTAATTVNTEKTAFRTRAQQAGISFTERYAYGTLFNGISLSTNKLNIAKIKDLPGVKAVYPVEKLSLPPTTVSNPDLFTALNMTGAATVQSELGYTGKGVKVAVMDTGIDYDHIGLGGDGVARSNSTKFPTARVIKGWDFVGDDFNADDTAASYNPIPVPDPYPDDCYGHGSHVAGIIGANDPTNGLKGVAPDVVFGSYRVFGCEGSTTSDIMLMAMEKAYQDGMQVLNMSIGSAFQWPQYPTAVAASRLVNKGMVVVASIGNSGANGLYSAGAPGLGENVIGVASFDNSNVFLPYFTVNGQNIGYITMTFSPAPPTSGTGEIVDVGLACDALPAGSITGKVALAARGTCSFAIKATNAIAAGADAVLISNNAAGVFSGTLGAPLANPKPVVGISQADGNFIRAQAAPITMTWTDKMASFPSPTGGLISSFSSYGLSPDLALKPDIGAPGGNIYSTYPLEKGGYVTMSGTSMSSPHVAGAVALYLQAFPYTKAINVRDALQNTADPKMWWGNPALGYLDNVNRQGAGMIQIDKAILATTRVTPGKLSLGESQLLGDTQVYPFARTLTIKNLSKKRVTYTFSYVNALSVYNTYSPKFTTSDAKVIFRDKEGVTIGPGGSYKAEVYIWAPTGPETAQFGGYIVITGSDGSVVRVPYAGIAGDYQKIQAMAPTSYGFPWLAVLYEGSFYKVTGPEDWVYSMVDGDVPYFLIHFDHQVQKLIFEVYKTNGEPVDWVNYEGYVEKYLPRNSTTTSFFAFPWDGTRIVGTSTVALPDGEYVVKILAYKAKYDYMDSDHIETWTSPVIKIDRP